MNAKLTLKHFLLGAGIIGGLTSCSYTNAKQEDSKEASNGYTETKSDDKVNEMDSKFISDVAVINLTEIQLGQLAENTGKMQDVKELGKMMEKDHSSCLKEVQSLAEKKAIVIPTSLTDKEQEEYKKLSELTGDDFDKEYCNKMIKGHKEAINKFEKALTDCKDSDIKDFTVKTLPTLRMHLEHSMDCQKKLENMKSM